MADRWRDRWSEPRSAYSSTRLRSRQPRTPADVLRYAEHLTVQLQTHEDAHGGLDRAQLAASASCGRMLLGLLDLRHALKTNQSELPGQAAAALRAMFAASAQLAYEVTTPEALRAMCALIHIRFPPWEEPASGTHGSAPAAVASRHAGQLGYTAVPGAPVVLSEQVWDESGATKANAPPPELIADPGWRDYPPDQEEDDPVARIDPRDPRSLALRLAQHEAVQLLLVLCGHGAGRRILHVAQSLRQPHLLEKLCELSRSVPWRWVPRGAPGNGPVAIWEEHYPIDERRCRLHSGCDALLLLGALAGLPGVEPVEAIGEAFFTLVEGFEPCLLAQPTGGKDAKLTKYIATRGCAAVAALRTFSRAHVTIVRHIACAPKVPLVHMLLRALQCATLEANASIPFQAEAAGLALPALQILEAIGRYCPKRLVTEASPDGCAQLVLLMDETAYDTAAAATARECLHSDAGWRRAVGNAASRVLVHMLVYDSPEGEALHSLLLAAMSPAAPAATTVAQAAAASRGGGGGHAACAAHVVWSALLCEHVDTAPLLKVICDSGSRGGAGEEEMHRWSESSAGVRRAWTHPASIARTRPSLGNAACAMVHGLLCAAGTCIWQHFN